MDSILKWEYKIGTLYVRSAPENGLSDFEELGKLGWEAVGPIFNTSGVEGFLFKRPCGEISVTKRISQEQERDSVSYDGYER